MNQALLDYSDKCTGAKKISTYQEFMGVFNEIKNLFPITMMDDYTIENCFREHGYRNLFHNFDPKKMDRFDTELSLLGDYDVIAVDDKSHIIWMIECKMLSKVASFYDMYMQQKNFFIEHGADERFQRRIDFMKNHYHRILDYLRCDSDGEYEIRPYMVINKVMISRYKPVNFPIISFWRIG